MAKHKTKAEPVSAGSVTSKSVAIQTSAYGCQTWVGKIAQGITEALQSAGVEVGVFGSPNVTGYSQPPPCPQRCDAALALIAPWTWRYDPALPTLGIIHETVCRADVSWGDSLRFARGVFAPSPWSVESIGKPARLFRFGVDRAFAYRPKSSDRPFRALFVAENAGDQRKGLDLAVAGFQKAFQGKTDVELVVRSIGRELEKDDQRISFAFGNMTPAQSADLYHSADVLIYSSKAEAFGMAALEAMACGTPAIHSGKTGMHDFHDLGLLAMSREIPGPDGQWWEPYSDEIAALLQQAYSHPEALRVKAKQDAEAVDKRYRWDVSPLLKFL